MKKGIKLAYTGITVNIIIAIIIMIAIHGDYSGLTDVVSDWPLSLGVGILALYISGKYIGNKMEFLIDHKKWNSILVGIIGSLIILIIGIGFGSTVEFIKEGIENIDSEYRLKNTLIDYYAKPITWILLFGIIPTIVVGGIIGYAIKKKS